MPRTEFTPGTEPGRHVAPGTDPGRWRAFVVCLMAGFMTLLDVSIVNVALPSMQAGLRISAQELSWVVAGYTLAFGLALVPSGRLGDGLGRRRVFLIGLVLFTGASLLCGLSVSGAWLVCARLAQGAAGGALTPQVVGLMQQLFTGRERGVASGFYGAMVAAATAVGPPVGGLLIQAVGWRWVFFVNVPIGVCAFVLGSRLLPPDRGKERAVRLDLPGVALLGAGIIAVMLPLIEAERRHGSPHWALLGGGAALLACFVAWERRVRGRGGRPLVDLGLLRRRPYATGTLIGVLYFAGYTGVVFVLPLYFQRGLGYSALAAGAAGTPFSIGSAMGAALSGRAVHRLGRLLVIAGAFTVVLALVGIAILIRHDHGTRMWLVTLVPLLVAGAGSGLVIGPNLTLALRDVPPAEGGTAAAVLQTGQRIGSAFGLAVAGSLFLGTRTASRGDFSLSAGRALSGSAALVGLALLVAVADGLRRSASREV
ncbi:MFS transporter [Actinoallomurus soli]|uniref:MFS transporter n=1 Tax=Actinoallomurus soli TaxID=2952535 RepID=UPI002092998C|nr:MFS transporter [Actinoallomurus soli]MCO5967327.1 MFS transporter [Actinoallomurus soli]